jgi:hypothetical protein
MHRYDAQDINGMQGKQAIAANNRTANAAALRAVTGPWEAVKDPPAIGNNAVRTMESIATTANFRHP